MSVHSVQISETRSDKLRFWTNATGHSSATNALIFSKQRGFWISNNNHRATTVQ